MSTHIEIIREGWEHFADEHGIGVRGFGPLLETACEQTALALVAVITNPRKVVPEQKTVFTCSAGSQEELLTKFLKGVLKEMTSRQMLFSQVEVRIEANRLKATLWGEKIDPARHQPAGKIKDATRIECHLQQGEADIWTAHCVVRLGAESEKRSP